MGKASIADSFTRFPITNKHAEVFHFGGKTVFADFAPKADAQTAQSKPTTSSGFVHVRRLSVLVWQLRAWGFHEWTWSVYLFFHHTGNKDARGASWHKRPSGQTRCGSWSCLCLLGGLNLNLTPREHIKLKCVKLVRVSEGNICCDCKSTLPTDPRGLLFASCSITDTNIWWKIMGCNRYIYPTNSIWI